MEINDRKLDKNPTIEKTIEKWLNQETNLITFAIKWG